MKYSTIITVVAILLSSVLMAYADQKDARAQCFVRSIDDLLKPSGSSESTKFESCAVLSEEPGTYTLDSSPDCLVTIFGSAPPYDGTLASFLSITQASFVGASFESTHHSIDKDQREIDSENDNVVTYPGLALHIFDLDGLSANPFLEPIFEACSACSFFGKSDCVLASPLKYELAFAVVTGEGREDKGNLKIVSITETLTGPTSTIQCQNGFEDTAPQVIFAPFCPL